MTKVIFTNKKFLFGLLMVLLIFICAIFANFLAPYGYEERNVGPKLMKPNLDYPFGTDEHGRDLLSRIIYGTRISLLVSISTGIATILIGIILGIASGFYSNSIIDQIIMRIVDTLLGIPWVILALMLAVIMGPGVVTVILSLTLVYFPQATRVIRSITLSIRSQDYITGAVLTGENDFNILLRYILPNTFNVVIVQFMYTVSFSILGEAALSFLGYGVRPPVPSWGLLLQGATKFIWTNNYLIIFPGITIIISVLSLNFFGDGLRDLLDPKYKSTYSW